MSVLGNIANRLQTDLADIGRATVDPAFSARLDAANFEDKRFQRERKVAVEDAENKRNQALADEARRQTVTTQMFAVNKLFDIAMDDTSGTGKGWDDYMRLVTSGKLEGEALRTAEYLSNSHGAKSFEAQKQEYAVTQDAAKVGREERKIKLQSKNYNNQHTRALAQLELQQRQEDRERADGVRKRAKESQNAISLIDYVRFSPAVSEKEREEFLPALEASPDYSVAVKIFDTLQSRWGAEAKAISDKLKASKNGGDGLAPGAAGKPDVELAETFRNEVEKVPGFSDLSTDDQGKFMTFFANEIKEIGKNTKEGGNDAAQKALRTAEKGIIQRAQEQGFFKGMTEKAINLFMDFKFDQVLETTFSGFDAASAKRGEGKATRRLNADGTFTNL